MLTATTRVYPIKPQNRVKTVIKTEDGDLAVVLASGERFTIDKDDDLFQAFVVYTILADL